MLTDAIGRSIGYLRFSVTDRCNLRCLYCEGASSKFEPVSHDELLRYEEIARLIALSRSLGIEKVRFTGGEPFCRKDFPEFLGRMLTEHPDLRFMVTTNGTFLQDQAKDLAKLGLARVNVSLDSLERVNFTRITGVDALDKVLGGIDAALTHGMGVKINAVALAGVNEHELKNFLQLTRRLPVDVRFIEFMPIGATSAWQPDMVWSAAEILAKAQSFGRLVPVEQKDGPKGPARLWQLTGAKGRFGIISPMTGHFCASCNRLRVTSEGALRTCLYSDNEADLRSMLRNPKVSDAAILRTIQAASLVKPVGADLLAARQGLSVCSTPMRAIGG